LLLEIQALVTESKLAIPRRMSTGIDPNRVNLLMAVLEKKAGFHLYNYDTYINVVGGLKIIEPACDLGVVSVIASSLKNRAVPENTVMIGELGLTGEVRAVNNIAKRINEAEKLGFTNCILPYINYNKMIKDKKSMDRYRNIEFHSIKNIQELLSIIFK
jgi:DNA repair protein RadA/Sms